MMTMLNFASPLVALCLAIAAVGATAFIYRSVKARSRPPYPPGPRGLPIIGIVFDFPQDQPWFKFRDWSQEYDSDILSFEVLGKRLVVLNSHTAAQELMMKRSAKYSDRPDLPMVNDLQGWHWNFGFRRYDSSWKEQRKLFKQEVDYALDHSAQDYARLASLRLLKSLLLSPKDYVAHLKHLTGYFTLSIAYGIDIKPTGDPYVEIAERANDGLVQAASFPPYLVDSIPALKYVPDWFPGAKFKREAKVWAKYCLKLREVAFQAAKEQFAQGTSKLCVASRRLESIRSDTRQEEGGDPELTLKSVLGVFYSAGVDTTLSSISTFVFAMVLRPEVQRQGQKAVLEAVGDNRLPEYDDIQSIPYLHAIVKEVFRWQPVIPLAIPHATSEDDVYKGYFIPKGSTVIGNAWAILRDESVFGPDTHLFKPERFLTKDGSALDPTVPNPETAFGFGRRICPGRFLAERLLLITVASLLHCFDIKRTKDADGKEIVPPVEYTTGLVSFPKPFQCEFKVRSTKLKELILEASKGGDN